MDAHSVQKLNIFVNQSFNDKKQNFNRKSQRQQQRLNSIKISSSYQDYKRKQNHIIKKYETLNSQRSINSQRKNQRKRHKKYFLNIFHSNISNNRSLYFSNKKQYKSQKCYSDRTQIFQNISVKNQINPQIERKQKSLYKTSIQSNTYNFQTQNGLQKFINTNCQNSNVLEYKQPIDFINKPIINYEKNKIKQQFYNDSHNKLFFKRIFNQRSTTNDSINKQLQALKNSQSKRKFYEFQNKQDHQFKDYNQISKKIKILKNVKDLALMNKKLEKKKRKVTENQWQYLQNLSKNALNLFKPIQLNNAEKKQTTENNSIKQIKKQNIKQRSFKNFNQNQLQIIQFPDISIKNSQQIRSNHTNSKFISKKQILNEQNNRQINLLNNKILQKVKKIQFKELCKKKEIIEQIGLNKNHLLKIRTLVQVFIDPIGDLPSTLIPLSKKIQIKSGIAIYFICRLYFYFRKIIFKIISNEKFNKIKQQLSQSTKDKNLIKWLSVISENNQDIKVTLLQMIKTISAKKQVSFQRKYLQSIPDNLGISELVSCIEQQKSIFLSKNIKIFNKIFTEFNKKNGDDSKLYQILFIYGYSILNTSRIIEMFPKIIQDHSFLFANNSQLQDLNLFQIKYQYLHKQQFQKLLLDKNKREVIEKEFNFLLGKIKNLQNN